MKSITKKILIILLSLYITANLTGGIIYQNNLSILLFGSLCLYTFNLIIKPLLNLIFMPINLLTLGASRWIINIIIFWAVTVFVDGFVIVPLKLSSFSLSGYSFPGLDLSFFWSLVLLSFIVQLCISVINWIFN